MGLKSSTKQKILAEVQGNFPVPTSCQQASQLLGSCQQALAGAKAKAVGFVVSDIIAEYIKQYQIMIDTYTAYLSNCGSGAAGTGTAVATTGSTDQVPGAVTPGGLDNTLGASLTDNNSSATSAGGSSAGTTATPAAAASKKKMILIGGIVLGVLIVGGIIWKMSSKKSA